jgi:hypothetical protein
MRTPLQLIALFLCLVSALTAMPPPADTAVSIVDTLYLQSATPWQGEITLSWPAFTASGGTRVAGGSRTFAITTGAISITLYSTVGAAPSFLYTAKYRSTGPSDRGLTWTETWSVPSSGTAVNLGAVRSSSTLGLGFTYRGVYANRPASPHASDVAVFTDATSGGACATSSGTSYAICAWTGSAWITAGSGIEGPVGPQGIQGITGTTGATGSTGPAGSGASYSGTSSNSLAIATGSKTFTTQSGLGYTVGLRLRAASAGTPTSYMEGIVTAYSGTSLTLSVDATGGSGSLADWNINVAGNAGSTGPQGIQGLTGLTGATGATGATGDAGSAAATKTYCASGCDFVNGATPTFAVPASSVAGFDYTLATNITSATLTTTAATRGQILQWIYRQPVGGGITVVHPTNLLDACDVVTDASVITTITAFWDGTNARAFACANDLAGVVISGPEISARPTPLSGLTCWWDSTDHNLKCKNSSGITFATVLGGIDLDPVTGSVTCGLAKQSPNANGTTDDATALAAAATACPGGITTTPGKQYAIKTTTTISAPVNFVDPPSGGAFLVSNSAVLTLNGTVTAPVRQIFAISGGGTVRLGAATPVDYAEWFGAARDNSTDDVTAINYALAAKSGGGTTQLLAGTYKVTTAIIIPTSYQKLVGNQLINTTINSTSTTADIIAPTQDSAANCGGTAVSGHWITIEHLTVARNTGSTQGKGINLTNQCAPYVHEVHVVNNVTDIYISGSAHPKIERVHVNGSLVNSTAANHIELDSSSNPVNSIRLEHVVATDSGTANKVGLYIHGATIADVFAQDFETAALDYCAKITSSTNSSTRDFVNGDIHLNNFVCDQIKVAGIQVSSVYGGGSASVKIIGGEMMGDSATNLTCIDLNDTQGVEVLGTAIRCSTSGSKGIYIHGSNSRSNRVTSMVSMTPIGISVSSNSNEIGPATFKSLSGTPATTNIEFTGTASRNIVTGVTMADYATTGMSFGASTANNIACPNTIDTTNITTDISNLGTSNTTSCGSGGSGSSNFTPVNAPAELWPMNEGAGTTLANLSGHANTATGSGITWSAGPGTCYKCAHFDGTFDTPAANQTNFNPTKTSSFSVSFWSSVDTNDSHQNVFVGQAAAGVGWLVWKNPTGGSYANEPIFFMTDGSTGILKAFACPLTAATLYHHVVTYSGTGTAAGVSYYVNGTLCAADGAAAQDNLTGSSTAGAPIHLGDSAGGSTIRLIGYLSNVQPYNRVLTSTEITALYAAGPMTTSWATKQPVTDTAAVTLFAGDGVTAATVGGGACVEASGPFVISGWRVRSLNGTSGSISVGVTKNGSSIVASAPPSITSSTSNTGSVSTWSGTTVVAGDLFCFTVSSLTSITYAQVTLLR